MVGDMSTDDLVTIHADPDDSDLRAAILVESDQVREMAGGEGLPNRIGEHHGVSPFVVSHLAGSVERRSFQLCFLLIRSNFPYSPNRTQVRGFFQAFPKSGLLLDVEHLTAFHLNEPVFMARSR